MMMMMMMMKRWRRRKFSTGLRTRDHGKTTSMVLFVEVEDSHGGGGDYIKQWSGWMWEMWMNTRELFRKSIGIYQKRRSFWMRYRVHTTDAIYDFGVSTWVNYMG